jgi:iron complex transport system substrate-binding protein
LVALSTASVAVVHRLSSPRGQAVSISGILARFAVRFGALAALLLWQSACRPSASPAASTRIVDDAGDTVVVPTAARRVVSLIPATTELLFAIGAGPAVIGRTAWCDYPAAAANVPNLGDGIAPNVEAVLASRPDLVILYNSAQNADVAARLRRLGIAALRLNTDSLGDVDRVGRLLGRLTGHARAADSVAAVFDSALAAATGPAPARRPKVLLLVWEQPPMTIGRGSFLSELVERAGGRNLFADVTSSAGTVSIEAVASRDPDLILTTTAGPVGFAERPEWQTVRAVRERRFLPVSGSEFNRPSPRAPAAIRELVRLLRERASMRKAA